MGPPSGAGTGLMSQNRQLNTVRGTRSTPECPPALELRKSPPNPTRVARIFSPADAAREHGRASRGDSSAPPSGRPAGPPHDGGPLRAAGARGLVLLPVSGATPPTLPACP